MRFFTQDIDTLRTLYIFNLKKALDMEKKVVSSLTNLVGRVTNDELSKALLGRLDESRNHVFRVEGLLRRLTSGTECATCNAMNALMTEASDTTGDVTDPLIRDIALIGVAQQMEHHEIAVYGTLRRWAVLLGQGYEAEVLESIEAEEINANEVLSELSERLNFKTAA